MKTELIFGTSLGATSNNPKYLVIHCSDVSYRVISDQFQSINYYHRDERQFPASSMGIYVGYHYLYTGSKEYKCRKENEVGAHCNQGFDGIKVFPPATPGKLSMNYQSIGLCVGFDGDIEQMPVREYELLQARVWDLQDVYKIPNENVFFHRKFATTKSCPGGLINDQWLKQLVTKPLPVPAAPKENPCTVQEATIADQKRIIFNLREVVASFINFINLRNKQQ